MPLVTSMTNKRPILSGTLYSLSLRWQLLLLSDSPAPTQCLLRKSSTIASEKGFSYLLYSSVEMAVLASRIRTLGGITLTRGSIGGCTFGHDFDFVAVGIKAEHF